MGNLLGSLSCLVSKMEGASSKPVDELSKRIMRFLDEYAGAKLVYHLRFCREELTLDDYFRGEWVDGRTYLDEKIAYARYKWRFRVDYGYWVRNGKELDFHIVSEEAARKIGHLFEFSA